MPNFTDDVNTPGAVNASSAKFNSGNHAEGKFDTVSARRLATACEHQNVHEVVFSDGTDVVARTQRLSGPHRGAGSLVEAKAWVTVRPAGGDKTVVVDVKRSRSGGAFATVLSATITISSSNPAAERSSVTMSISDTTVQAGDLFQAVVTVAGSTGTQCQGLTIQLVTRENPD